MAYDPTSWKNNEAPAINEENLNKIETGISDNNYIADFGYAHSISPHAPVDANNYVHPLTTGYKHIPTGGTVGQVLMNISSGTASWTTLIDNDTIYDDTQIQSEVDLNTLKVSNVDHPVVYKEVPIDALFTDTDTIYDDTQIQSEVDLNTAKVSNVDHPIVYKEVPVDALFTDTTYSNVSEFTNDSGYLTSYTETDPVYTASPAYGISSSDITSWDSALQSGDNISVLNNDTGYITGIAWGSITGTLSNQTDLQAAIDNATYDDTQIQAEVDSLIQVNTDTNEPTGFIREHPMTMGVLELSPDGTTIHRVMGDGTTSTNTSGVFYDGTAASARTFSISPIAVIDGGDGTYSLYIEGDKYTKTSSSQITLVNQTGLQFLYFDVNGDLASDVVLDLNYFEDTPIVCTVYGNQPGAELVIFGDERHGITMDGATHRYLHFSEGARYVSGMEIEGLVSGNTTYTQVASGVGYDEDIVMEAPNQATAPHWYFLWDAVEGKNGWRVTTESNEIGLIDTVAQYNPETGGEYGLSPIVGNDAMIVFYALTNDSVSPYVKILGQEHYASVNIARADIENALGKLLLTGLPSPEFLPIGACIVNRLGELQILSDGSLYYDLRQVKVIGSSGTSGTSTYHPDLLDRDLDNAHPISAITGLQVSLDNKVDDSQVLTNVPAGALFTDTDTIYDDSVIQAEVDLNTAKVSNVSHPVVYKEVPIDAVFTDTTYTNVSEFTNDSGYLTSYTETDPVFIASPAYGILTDDINSWDTAYGWGNHASYGYLTTVSWGSITGTLSNQSDLNTALSNKVDDSQVLTNVPAGALFTDTVYDDTAIQAEVDLNTAKVSNISHPLVETAVPSGAVFTDTTYTNVSEFTNDSGYLTSYTETDPVFVAHASYGITSTDLSNYDTAYAHVSSTSNPHSITKTQVGLSNVDNTSDVNKPVSTATTTALAEKLDTDDTETGASALGNIVSLTQTSYDALTPVSDTLYVIVG